MLLLTVHDINFKNDVSKLFSPCKTRQYFVLSLKKKNDDTPCLKALF